MNISETQVKLSYLFFGLCAVVSVPISYDDPLKGSLCGIGSGLLIGVLFGYRQALEQFRGKEEVVDIICPEQRKEKQTSKSKFSTTDVSPLVVDYIDDSIRNGREITVIYHGGSTAGDPREIFPIRFNGNKLVCRPSGDGGIRNYLLHKIEAVTDDGEIIS
ncbi:hypothetical protein [Photobacterium indicum]|uniref:WYL domain-containing protein n=1 Tax=Photobacterium indicum TaxID=81447 RepID=A0A2T3L3E6_9GAMM|nr:hypothetical protein [Photobacterium indicum]PSV43619.1 hypothetical protein C9J47_22385 [Photobacterium indicum]